MWKGWDEGREETVNNIEVRQEDKRTIVLRNYRRGVTHGCTN